MREPAIDSEYSVHARDYVYTPEGTENGRNQSNGISGINGNSGIDGSESGSWRRNGSSGGVSQVDKGERGKKIAQRG